MDGEGKLHIQLAWNAGETPYEIFPENTFKREFGDASFGPLKGLSVSLHGAKRNAAPLIVQADDTPLDAFNSLSIANNPLFSAEDASAPGRIRQLLNALEGMAFTRLLVHWQGDAALHLGRRIRVHDTKGGFTDSCVTSLGFTADNGFSMQTDCTFQKPVSSAGRIFTPSGGLNAAMLQGTSDAAFLKAESITAQHLAAQAVTAEKLDAASVTAEKIAAGEVKADHLASASVTAEKIAAEAIRADHLSAGAVTAEKIGAGEIAANHIQSKSITAGQLSSGLITADSGLIAAGAIGTAQIADGSITEAKIVSLNADVIKSGTLHTDRLLLTGEGGVVYEINAASSGLSKEELEGEEYRSKMDGSVLVSKSVTAQQIAAETITANEILSGAITTEKLDAAAVTTEKLAAQSVTANKLSSDVGSSLDLSSNQSVLLMVGQVENAVAQIPGLQMHLSFDRGSALESEKARLVVQVHVFRNEVDITEKLPASAFSWHRQSGDAEMDALWDEAHPSGKTITLEREEIGKSCQLSCTLHVYEGLGDFSIENGELFFHGDEEDAAFFLENGCLMGPEGVTLEAGELLRKTLTVTTSVFDHSVLETSHILIRDQRIDVKTGGDLRLSAGGTFTVESGNFQIDAEGNVAMNGRVEAEEGMIGGWEIGPGALKSGEGESHVRLSTGDATYALWAGAENVENAPFRVARDGTTYITKMYVVDENGVAKEQPVDLRSSWWQVASAYGDSIVGASASAPDGDGNVTLTFFKRGGAAAFSVNFRKAGFLSPELRQGDPQGRAVFVYNPTAHTYNVQKTVYLYNNNEYTGQYETINETSGTEAYVHGWNDCVDGLSPINHVYTIKETAPGELWLKVGDQYTSVGSSWVRTTAVNYAYYKPGKKE